MTVLFSCTTTRIVGNESIVSRNDKVTYNEVNARLRSQSGCVYLTDCTQLFGNIEQIKSDSVWIVEKKSRSVVAIPIKAIQRIEQTDRVEGFFGGLFIGACVGFVVGDWLVN